MSELACHLEEMFMDLRHAGASEEHAFAAVLKAGKDLGPTVRRLRWQREGGLRPWLRTVVLPGLILSLFYGVCNIALGVYWENSALSLEVRLVLVSIALGFCASSFSRELGGRETHRVWAAVLIISFQAAALCVMALVVTPLELVRNAQYLGPGYITGVVFSLLRILSWDVMTPAIALVIGSVISVCAFPAVPPDHPNRCQVT